MPCPLTSLLLPVLLSYLLGAVPFGYIIGKLNGIDIRQHGSGNIGATNVRRVLGMKWGALCFFLDFSKGALPVFLVKFLLLKYPSCGSPDAIMIGSAFATVAGHLWPVYLNFKGGKGVATTAGVLLALAPLALICSGALWAAVFFGSRYVSLASIAAAAALPFFAFGFSKAGLQNVSMPILVLLFVLAALAIAKHHANIKRLLNGTELKFERKDKENTENKN